jgi:ribonucleoside-diphosphate reductase alpha chain
MRAATTDPCPSPTIEGYEAVIDVYAAATQHVDQGLSLTLVSKDTTTTRDIDKAKWYAWKSGIKTMSYS